MGYSWRKANFRPRRYLAPELPSKRILIYDTIKLLKVLKYTIVWVDEVHFTTDNLNRHTWSKKGQEADKIVYDNSNRYNAIAAKWDKNVYFNVKSSTTDATQFIDFIDNLWVELAKTLTKV